MSRERGTHEDYDRRTEVQRGSERAFGLVFAAVFALIAVWPWLGGGPVRIWALVVAAGCAAIALVRPRLLAPLNALWFRFGLLLHRIVSPLVLGVLFYLVLTPTALVMRLAGKDPLRLRFEPEAPSYWIRRSPPGPAPKSMQNQF